MNKTEHEKFYDIAEEIGYFIHSSYIENGNNGYNLYHDEELQYRVDVREIIFTQEFMDRYVDYCCKNIEDNETLLIMMIMKSLDNPIDYLYNTIGLGK